MNAVILAAGTASRFVPLSEETPKGLLEVRGEILIERQIRQLRESGVDEICVVLGYKAELFHYLEAKFGVKLFYNEDYRKYNNSSSIIRIVDRLDETFICCSDHYYVRNVFLDKSEDSYYAAQFAQGHTDEWCLKTDRDDWILDVEIGGENAWYMAGHAYFNSLFSEKFRHLLKEEYQNEAVRQGYWEDLLIRHLADLPMKMRRYASDDFKEFDSIDELREFDTTYLTDTRSRIVKDICCRLSCSEENLSGFKRVKHPGDYLLFTFRKDEKHYQYDGRTGSLLELTW